MQPAHGAGKLQWVGLRRGCCGRCCWRLQVGKRAEAGGIAKDGAKMVMAVANAKVGG
jgi:hypothetical protein